MALLSKSITQVFRKNMLLVGSGFRGLFAPWDYKAAQTNPLSTASAAAGGPNILDLQVSGPFNFNTPPSGWTDTGWIKEFKTTPQTKIGQVRSGFHGAVRAQYVGQVGEQFEFKFNEYGRLQFKLASGRQVFNILKSTSSPSTVGPMNSPGPAAVSMTAYSVVGGTATLTVASASGFAADACGDPVYIVADIDMGACSGIVGENGTFVFPSAVSDVDFIRKTSDFVARVQSISGNVLTLDQPFVGGGSPAATNGTPPAGSKVQQISGWAMREGGSFIQEWSGLFICDSIDGAQIAVYYPHISPNQFRGHADWTLENVGTTDAHGLQMDCMFEALAFDDPIDGDTIVNYSAMYVTNRTQNTY